MSVRVISRRFRSWTAKALWHISRKRKLRLRLNSERETRETGDDSKVAFTVERLSLRDNIKQHEDCGKLKTNERHPVSPELACASCSSSIQHLKLDEKQRDKRRINIVAKQNHEGTKALFLTRGEGGAVPF